MTYDQVIDKARLLDYLWKTWKALELYEQNFSINKNDKSIAYNHNMARLYDKLWAYKQALIRYWFIVEYFNRGDYLKDMAKIFEKMWDEEKAKKAMDWYNKIMWKDNTTTIKAQEVNVSEDWVLELK